MKRKSFTIRAGEGILCGPDRRLTLIRYAPSPLAMLEGPPDAGGRRCAGQPIFPGARFHVGRVLVECTDLHHRGSRRVRLVCTSPDDLHLRAFDASEDAGGGDDAAA